MPHPLALANAAYLAQGARLLRGLDDAQYRASAPPLYPSGVGGHFRHCLEHVQLLLAAAATTSGNGTCTWRPTAARPSTWPSGWSWGWKV